MESFNRLPDREVDDELRGVSPAEVGGIAFLELQTPDEAWACLSEAVDRVYLRHKIGNRGGIEGRCQSPDVELCQLVGSHSYMVAAI